jgi:hypothetical protein
VPAARLLEVLSPQAARSPSSSSAMADKHSLPEIAVIR